MSVRIVLLCEDLQMATFLRRFLKRRNWSNHQIRTEIAPSGRGSGEQWVRTRYPVELKAMRQRRNVVLVVCTDADTMTVVERIATLDGECDAHRVARRSPNEAVAMIVPKRNIETWFAYLGDQSCNEVDRFPRYPNESDCRNDVGKLDSMCHARKLREPAPDSLRAACVEFSRIPGPGG